MEPRNVLPYPKVWELIHRAPTPEEQKADALVAASEAGRLVRLQTRGIPDQPLPLLAREGLGYWTDWLKGRARSHWDAVVVFTGKEGGGKSTLALRMATAVDQTFTVDARVCYTAKDVLSRFRDTEPGRVIVFDEGARALLGTDTFARDQKALVKALMLVREKGIVTFVCIPRIHELARSMRLRRACLWVHCVARGVGLVHERDERLRYQEDAADLGFHRSGVAPYLQWSAFAGNSKLWRQYLRLKTQKLEEFLQETEDELDRGPRSESERKRANRERKRKSRAKQETADTQDEDGGTPE